MSENNGNDSNNQDQGGEQQKGKSFSQMAEDVKTEEGKKQQEQQEAAKKNEIQLPENVANQLRAGNAAIKQWQGFDAEIKAITEGKKSPEELQKAFKAMGLEANFSVAKKGEEKKPENSGNQDNEDPLIDLFGDKGQEILSGVIEGVVKKFLDDRLGPIEQTYESDKRTRLKNKFDETVEVLKKSFSDDGLKYEDYSEDVFKLFKERNGGVSLEEAASLVKLKRGRKSGNNDAANDINRPSGGNTSYDLKKRRFKRFSEAAEFTKKQMNSR